MNISTEDVAKVYELFNDGNIEALVEKFAPDATYCQINSGFEAQERGQIRAALDSWRQCFTGAQIKNVEVLEAPHLVHVAEGAAWCFLVSFLGVGRYDFTMRGFDEIGPAHRQRVNLPISEIVWFDEHGLIRKVDNEVLMQALR